MILGCSLRCVYNLNHMAIEQSPSPRGAMLLLKIFAVVFCCNFIFAVFMAIAIGDHNPRQRAIFCMAIGLMLLWVGVGGFLSYHLRYHLRSLAQRSRLPWPLLFVIACTVLALIEEAITTSMTNLAPAFGSTPREAFITASTNYLDVVLGHSVIYFVPMFLAWAWLLKRYSFDSISVLLLFGFTGTLTEMSFAGPQHIAEIGLWMFVYGLMVFLPADAIPPSDRKVIPPRFQHYLLAVFVPFLFMILSGPPLVLIHHLRPSTMQTLAAH